MSKLLATLYANNMSFKDAPIMGDWLGNQELKTREVLNRGRLLASMNQALKDQWAQEIWIDQIRIANIRGTTLVVFVQTAAALIPLRYKKQALLDFLKREFELRCTELDAKVVPNH